ncbi:MAG: hypothetical protein AB1696_26945 [Planctomycetota bacterium]
MPAQVKCPSCGKLFAIDGSKFGSQVNCPGCNHAFVAAKPGEAAPKKEESILSDDISIDMSLHPSQTPKQPAPAQKAPAAPAAPPGKTCPSCNAPMDAAAIICPKCRLNVMTGKKLAPRAEAEVETEAPSAAAVSGKTVALIAAAAVVALLAFWFHFLRGSSEETPTAEAPEKTETPAKAEPDFGVDEPAPKSEKKPDKPDKSDKPDKKTDKKEVKEDKKPQGDRDARLAELKELRHKRKFKNQGEECLKQADHREGNRKWEDARDLYKQAIEHYAQSDEPGKAEEIKKHLAAVEKVIKGVALEGEKKWDEAIAIYKEAQPDLVNQIYIGARVDFITRFKKYATVFDQAEADLTAGKWEEAKKGFEKASQIADELSLKDEKIAASNQAEGVEKVRVEFEGMRDDMRWTMEQLDKEKSGFGLYAAIQHYLRSDRHKIYHDEPKAKLEAVKKALESEESLRVDKAEKRTVLTLKDGSKLQGNILDKTEASIKFRAVDGLEAKVTSILNVNIAKQEDIEVSAEEINTERAGAILAQAAGENEQKAWYKALAKLGMLLYYFSDVPLVQNKDLQGKIIKDAGGAEVGASVDELLAAAVVHCEALCPVCRGKGEIPCTMCKQKGKRLETCSKCAFDVWCPHCGMEQLCQNNHLVHHIDCIKCKKKFAPLEVMCPFCHKPFFRKVTDTGEIRCPNCEKRGEIKTFTPEEKLPLASGTIFCPVCRGTGKTGGGRCPKCKGRKALPCPQCEKGHKGMMLARCPYCRPGDFIMKCPECDGRGVRAGKGTKAKL